MINIVALILLIMFKDEMNPILWWAFMTIDIWSFVCGIAIYILKEKRKQKEEELLRDYINGLVDRYLL